MSDPSTHPGAEVLTIRQLADAPLNAEVEVFVPPRTNAPTHNSAGMPLSRSAIIHRFRKTQWGMSDEAIVWMRFDRREWTTRPPHLGDVLSIKDVEATFVSPIESGEARKP